MTCDWQQATPESHVQTAFGLLHLLSVFTLAVLLFRFTLQQNHLYDNILNAKLFCFLNYISPWKGQETYCFPLASVRHKIVFAL